jgi:sugar diacid utilization regulator
VLRYSREFAFTTAEVYARAAEERGSWDARLEALAMNALVRGQAGQALRSRIAALGWTTEGPITTVVVGLPAPLGEQAVSELRHHLRRNTRNFLLGFHGDRCLLVLGDLPASADAVARLVPALPAGPVVIGPEVKTLEDVPDSLRAANSGLDALPAWPEAPRPVGADELLPERALIGDAMAVATLRRIYQTMMDAGRDSAKTLGLYQATGRSLEGAARLLYVHPNTVRYRLGKISDLTGWDPTDPRETFVLQTALACGRLAEAGHTWPANPAFVEETYKTL